jgi:UDP-N-acetylglucosamine acyltransferase
VSNRIHPTAVIGDGVELGDGNEIGPYTVVLGPAVIGDGNWIGPHCTIGSPASDRSAPHPARWADAPVGDPQQDGFGVVIGDGNRIREYFSAHQGTRRPTRVGSDGYFLRSSHLAHDVQVGDGVTLGSNVVVGGHGEVWSLANLGLGVVVHQHGTIGPGAMVGMGAAVTREIGPFTISRGVPAQATGLNVVGLSRRGVSEQAIAALEPYVLEGTGELPGVELPGEVAALLKEWDAHRRGTRGDD